jgi:hypothetical protein
MNAIKQLNNLKRDISRLGGVRRMDCDVVHQFLIELYQASRDGQAAVEAFCDLLLTNSNEFGFDPEYEWDRSPCEPCEVETPTVPDEHDSCAVCSSSKNK